MSIKIVTLVRNNFVNGAKFRMFCECARICRSDTTEEISKNNLRMEMCPVIDERIRLCVSCQCK